MSAPHYALIVDDDLMIRGLLATILRRHGILCDFAENGEEAIERLKDGPYSFMLLDLMMPRVDGFAVVDFVRERGLSIPIVVVTAAGPARTRELDPTVVKAVLTKPFEIRELIGTVTALCQAVDLASFAGSAR